ncbi:uncharacterized protein LOC124198777 [Daphnia pulex]|uniref:uncharacterized protein LOC124198777 n=1 Tax=Daphnia pulex TaxID=6669 RepID=UPI001EE098C7|nr:uncharacterized protein LOC124198777 [Daphnia pulex]
MIHPDKQPTFIYFLVIVFALTLTTWIINNRIFQSHLCISSTPAIFKNDFSEATFKSADQMSAKEIFRYLHWTNSTSCLFAVDFGFNIVMGDPITAPDGHKAVCLDPSVSPEFDDCLVYSFGINNQWSFDEAMAQYGCHVFAFDPSMGVGDHDRSPYIHFYKLGLAGNEDLQPSGGWNVSTASSIYQMLTRRHGDKVVDVIKMDVEFAEWQVIPQMLRSGFLADKVKQLAVEIHFKQDDPLELFQSRIGVLQELESTSSFSNKNKSGKFVRFSSRPNLWLKRPISILGGQEEFIGLELAWYNSRFYEAAD